MKLHIQIISLLMVHLIIFMPVSFAFSMFNFNVHNITDTTARISWNTGTEPTNATLKYGMNIADTVLTDNNFQTTHEFLLTGLNPYTYYVYAGFSSNSAGETKNRSIDVTTDPYRFRTLPTPDTTAPAITEDVLLQLPSDNIAVITWKTDEASNTYVYYGTSNSQMDQVFFGSGYSQNHQATLNVVDGTTYYFKVASCDQDDNCLNLSNSAYTFTAGQDVTPPTLQIDVPEKWGKTTLNLRGQTEPNARVMLYIDNSVKLQKYSNMSGGFDMQLSVAQYSGTRIINFTIFDQVGYRFDSPEYPIEFNFTPPYVELDDIPLSSNTTSLTITGTVDMLSNVTFSVSSRADNHPPEQVTGLISRDVGTNSIELAWDDSSASDLYEYAIYRDNVLIATVDDNHFLDMGSVVGSGVTYTYRVSAVDKSCNEGLKSNPIDVTTITGGQSQIVNPEAVNLSCSAVHYTSSRRFQGHFSETVPLTEGKNFIEVTAVNEYGLRSAIQKTISVDTIGPEIIDNNMDELGTMEGPTYNRAVTITGTVSEPAKVYVYKNGESSPSYSADTDADNAFKVDVHLDMNSDIKVENHDHGTSGTASIGYLFENDIKLKPVDLSGKNGSIVDGKIYYAQCSSGSWFSVSFHDQTPDMLSPRLIYEGVSQIGISVDIKWNAGGFTNATIIGKPKIGERALSVSERDKWDTSWAVESMVCDNQESDYYKCYLMIKLRAQDPTPDGENWTLYQIEDNISNHRLNECPVKGTGCIKLPLVLETDFQTLNSNQTEKQVNCLDVYAYIDRRVSPDVIPETFLKTMISLLNTTIDSIDTVLDPLASVRVYTLGACMVMYGVNFVMQFLESYKCQFQKLIADLSLSKVKFHMAVAQANMCEHAYGSENRQGNSQDDSSQAYEACTQCFDAIKHRFEVQSVMQKVCDRMFCPSAPTFQKFHKDSVDKFGGIVKKNKGTGDDAKLDVVKLNMDELTDWDKPGYSYDCALVPESQTNTYLKNHVDDAVDTDCYGPHQPSASCCKSSYMERWDTSCIMMDEFKESACLYAQLTNNPDKIGNSNCHRLWNSVAGFCDANGGAKPELVKVGRLYVNPSCVDDPDDLFRASSDRNLYIRIMPKDASTSKKLTGYNIEAGYIHNRVLLASQNTAVQAGQPSQINSQIEFQPITKCNGGDLSDFFNIEAKNNKAAQTNSGGQYDYDYEGFAKALAGLACEGPPTQQSSVLNYERVPVGMGQEIIISDDCSKTKKARDLWKASAYESGGKYYLTEDLVKKCTGKNTQLTYQCPKTDAANLQAVKNIDNKGLDYVKEVHSNVLSNMGISGKDYVVEPSSTFLRSVQCVCLSAIYSYLKKWRTIMMVLKNCFQTIQITGDGSPGICRSAISVYLCDFLYDALRCFSEKYGSVGSRSGFGLGIGNVLGAITDAASRVSDRINSRYDGNHLFNAVIGEGKVAHSVCMWAFTGTWELDPSTMLDTAGDVPIASTGAVYPCTRRFVSYNQAKNGLTTQAYSISTMLVAGSDLTYNLELECSDGYNCNPQEGFPNGRCDCTGSTTGAKTRSIKSGTLKSGDYLDNEFFQAVQDDGVRYDKAKLTWSYKDNNDKVVTDSAECTIKQAGGSPPSFCEFDMGKGQFRCDMNIGTDSYAYFRGDPTPNYNNGQWFRLGETMSFTVPVAFKKPQESNCDQTICDYTKWLYLKILDQNGREVCKSDYHDIFQEGESQITLEGCKLKQDDFTSVVTISKSFGSKKSSYPAGIKLISYPPSLRSSRVVYVGYSKAWNSYYISENIGGVVEIGADPDRPDTGTSKLQNILKKCQLNGNILVCTAPGGAYTFNLGGSYENSGWYAIFNFVVNEDTCNPDSDRYFTAQITMYNSRDDGSGSYMVDVNSIPEYNNKPQQKPNIKFKVRCDRGGIDSNGNTFPVCPDPMYLNWVQSGLSGSSKCTCGTDTCNSNEYCIDGSCHTTPATVPDCPVNMQSWGGFTGPYINNGPNAQCKCGSSETCKKTGDAYCITNSASENKCYSYPACSNEDIVLTQSCYCPKDGSHSAFDTDHLCHAGAKCESTDHKCHS